MDWVRWILAPVPGADEALRTLSTGAPLDWVKTIGAMLLGAVIAFITSAETIKLIWKTAFRKKSEMTEQLKSQAGHIAELIGQIDGLRADKQRLERRVADELAKHPGAAIARAEKDLRDRNESSAIYHLEEWFNGNASSIGAIAPLRKVWFQVEPRAIFYQIVAGHHEAALDRIDFVLTEARIHLTVRDRETLDAQNMRARVLQDLGRSADALAEIDAFAPIQTVVMGARNWHTLATLSLRIGIDIAQNRYVEHMARHRESASGSCDARHARSARPARDSRRSTGSHDRFRRGSRRRALAAAAHTNRKPQPYRPLPPVGR